MSKSLKPFFIAVLFMGTALASPVLGQTAEELSGRLNQMEEQMRMLVGQVEELTFVVKQLKGQLGKAPQTGAVEAPAKQKLALQPSTTGQEVEEIQDGAPQEVMTTVVGEDGTEQQVVVRKAPGEKLLGAISDGSAAAASPEDGGFQGQVLVPPGADGQTASLENNGVDPDAIETVSLSAETPEALYERSNESLLRRQFADAEAGFQSFVEKYPDHNLAGSAQFWLGETYYAQGDFRQAAKNFLAGYKNYPKSRRAPDSLLKLGISLNKLGQTQQACASFGALGGQYPNAVDAKKRAQAEFKRAAC